MNGQYDDSIQPERRFSEGASVTEAIVGLGAIALAIIALANILPWLLASISTIALGAAFLFEASAVEARFSALKKMATGNVSVRSWGRLGSLTAEFLAGCAGIALGVLSLLGISQATLIPVAVIAYGAALVIDSGMRVALSAMESEHFGFQGARKEVASETAAASSGVQVLVGACAAVLGILAIIGMAPLTLSLVGLLSAGAAMFVVGSVVGGRMMSMFRS